MYCPKCNRFTLQIEHINVSGNLTKLCFKCLKNQKIQNLFIIEDLEEINSLVILPLSYILVPIDLLEDQTLLEFGSDFADLLFETLGVKFRYIIHSKNIDMIK